jgi:hypothetical protein
MRTFFTKKHLFLWGASLLFFALFLLFFHPSFQTYLQEERVYRSIQDITHPTTEDYLRLQEYLSHGKRAYLKLLGQNIRPDFVGNYDERARKFRLIGPTKEEMPLSETICYHCSLEDKDVCILSYASYNKNYKRGIERLKQVLQKMGYKGHFVYQIGGWPNLSEKSLRFAHVPYAFKTFFFRELQKKGYKKVLWLDCSILPLQPLDFVFATLEKQGYFGYATSHPVGDYINRHVLDSFHLSYQEACTIKTVETGILGLDFSKPIAHKILDLWEESLKNGGFLSSRPEQNAFSIIAHRLGLFHWEDASKRPCNKEEISPDAAFFVDWAYIQ